MNDEELTLKDIASPNMTPEAHKAVLDALDRSTKKMNEIAEILRRAMEMSEKKLGITKEVK